MIVISVVVIGFWLSALDISQKSNQRLNQLEERVRCLEEIVTPKDLKLLKKEEISDD